MIMTAGMKNCSQGPVQYHLSMFKEALCKHAWGMSGNFRGKESSHNILLIFPMKN